MKVKTIINRDMHRCKDDLGAGGPEGWRIEVETLGKAFLEEGMLELCLQGCWQEHVQVSLTCSQPRPKARKKDRKISIPNARFIGSLTTLKRPGLEARRWSYFLPGVTSSASMQGRVCELVIKSFHL